MKKPSAQRRGPSRPATQRMAVAKANAGKRNLPTMPPHLTRWVAFGMIGLAAAGGFVLANVPIGIGLSLLAAIRVWLFLREERKQRSDQQSAVSDQLKAAPQ